MRGRGRHRTAEKRLSAHLGQLEQPGSFGQRQPLNLFNAPIGTPLKLHELLAEAAHHLDAAQLAYGHGTTNAQDEAAWLMLWQLGLPLDSDLDALSEQTVSTEQQADVRALIQRRIDTREPAAYLTQEAWLQGVPFYIDRRAIVPRSFIAELIAEGSIDHWLGAHPYRAGPVHW